MSVKRSLSYLALLTVIPISYLLHGINENFGLIPLPVIGSLLVQYLLIAVGVGVVCLLVFREASKAFVYSTYLLIFYFLFGIVHDLVKGAPLIGILGSYKFLLPLCSLVFLLIYRRLRNAPTVARVARFLTLFLAINIVFEAGWFAVNAFTQADVKQDIGDGSHTLIDGVKSVQGSNMPSVFWFVFDEYMAPRTINRIFGVQNPADSLLRSRGFFIPEKATSNYGLTPYSIASMLDMSYLPGLANIEDITLTYVQKSAYSINENNTVSMFERAGYNIYNLSIFDFKGHPSKGIREFAYVPKALIDYQTLAGRIKEDILFNFVNLFAKDRRIADSIDASDRILTRDSMFNDLTERSMQAIRTGASNDKPGFYLFHYMLPHNPFVYRADGSLMLDKGINYSEVDYPAQAIYCNLLIKNFIDSVQTKFQNKNIAIIVQGDHGYKFDKQDPRYTPNRFSILYGIYCSDGDYKPWENFGTSVNSFRVLFNKYLNTRLPLLPDSSHSLFYTR